MIGRLSSLSYLSGCPTFQGRDILNPIESDKAHPGPFLCDEGRAVAVINDNERSPHRGDKWSQRFYEPFGAMPKGGKEHRVILFWMIKQLPGDENVAAV
ncbi:hypothetical protein LQ318_09050 [Aliifodinibius salicampi]|uniref:Uncharacterized protein n=1 Tax=Fodinibius salicampi TaxID=1920655 RepID=A0ABT3PYW1_9BACT|nr:hypothetical protein [Fodinibius salicampi]MCW9713050.1 hypothetical protein [Fodinibius salicampi]